MANCLVLNGCLLERSVRGGLLHKTLANRDVPDFGAADVLV